MVTFSNVVGSTSVKGFGSSEDSGNDTVVFASTATDVNVDFAGGADSLHFSKAQPTQLLQQPVSDTVVAALTFASSSISGAAGDDSLSLSVLSLSTLTAGSGADTINLAKRRFFRGLYQPGQ